ncbi:DUF7793 family protein [Aurantibacillus circumpalustris]|uniref:DUF7793 family protein n=1 Tax=Aurantibacillus circumpalustris TaxID=3036359 RepID=UPI00295B34BC|nr:hypothetical protein [Aurantibacillus circumpalustris]
MTGSKINLASQSHDFDGYTISKRKDGIVQVQFKPGFSIDIEHAKHMVTVIESIKENEKCLFLVVFEEDNTFSMETRNYFSSDAVSKIIKADALVIKGLAWEILGRGYLQINKPNRPTRLFKSAAIGTMWLLNNIH